MSSTSKSTVPLFSLVTADLHRSKLISGSVQEVWTSKTAMVRPSTSVQSVFICDAVIVCGGAYASPLCSCPWSSSENQHSGA